MVRLFIYEFVSAGGLGANPPASLLREGWAMLRAIAEDFAAIPGVYVTTLIHAEHRDTIGHECRRIAAQEEPDAFRACAANADATLVIAPEFNDHLLERSHWVCSAGRRLLGSLPTAVRLAGDKLATAQHWIARGVRTPGTIVASVEPPTEFDPPWVCKPRHGAGSQATFLVRARNDWPAAFDQASADWPAGDLVVQPLVPGMACSIAFLAGPAQQGPLIAAAQRLSDDGRFQYQGGRLPLSRSLQDRAIHVARSALAGIDGLQGFVGIDLILGSADDGTEDYAIEINPRLTTSYLGLRRLCRDNLAQAWLDVVAGQHAKLHWRTETVEFDANSG
jgi:predicted ATP-grasp superfamily ATP-dependent carboligase